MFFMPHASGRRSFSLALASFHSSLRELPGSRPSSLAVSPAVSRPLFFYLIRRETRPNLVTHHKEISARLSRIANTEGCALVAAALLTVPNPPHFVALMA